MDMVDTLTNRPKDSKSNNSPRKKFLFDVNIFDEPEEEEIPAEPPPPPPPSFSESQLEAARKSAFEQGRQQGLQESLQSREEKLAALMARITEDCHTLFAQEAAREKICEQEALKITLAAFKRLFPLYHALKGFDELKAVITDVLSRQEGQSEILIETALSQKDGIEAHISRVAAISGKTVFKVLAAESLREGECKLSWTNGGAFYNANALADEIQGLLEEALAISPANVHDKGIETDQFVSHDKNPQEHS